MDAPARVAVPSVFPRIVRWRLFLDPVSHRLVRTMHSQPGLLVGDSNAQCLDQRHAVGAHLPLAIGPLDLVTFGVLHAATRSLVLPLKVLVMNVLTLAATLGVSCWSPERPPRGLLLTRIKEATTRASRTARRSRSGSSARAGSSPRLRSFLVAVGAFATLGRDPGQGARPRDRARGADRRDVVLALLVRSLAILGDCDWWPAGWRG